MPWRLYRYIIRDLLRVLGLTAGVLVTVIAFGATIKPLANETLLDAAQTAKYMSLAIVPMLQFALPFAAGFAATITLHRMTSDNEILAMSASGISYGRIMLPLAGLGAALTIFMIVLTQLVIPRFWVLIEQTLARDVVRVFQASIEKGDPFRVDRLRIYADKLIVEEQPADSQADTRLRLWRVAAAELDREGRIVVDVTANQAVVDVYRRETGTYLKLVLTDTVAFRPELGQLAGAPQLAPSAIMLPSSSRDEPKAMTRGQLLHLRKSPEQYRQVQDLMAALAESVHTEQVRQAMRDQLKASGTIQLSDPTVPNRVYEIHADRIDDDRVLNRGRDPLKVIQVDGGRPVREVLARTVNLTQSGGTALQELSFDLELIDCQVRDVLGGGGVNERSALRIPNLTPPGITSGPASQLALGELRAVAEPLATSSRTVRHRVEKLEDKIDELLLEITARLHARYALSLTAMLLLLLGSTLAIWLRGSLPLTIYLWAFVPSILDLILISAGEQLMRDGKAVGPALMWSGNAVLLLIWGGALFRLSRN